MVEALLPRPLGGDALLRSPPVLVDETLTLPADDGAQVRTPLGRYGGEGTDFIAHQGAVNSVSWSHDSSLLLTAGADRTAHLWSSGA